MHILFVCGFLNLINPFVFSQIDRAFRTLDKQSELSEAHIAPFGKSEHAREVNQCLMGVLFCFELTARLKLGSTRVIGG
jgi:hypothetical protein